LPGFMYAGGKGVLTFLYGHRPEAQHLEIMFDQVSKDFHTGGDVAYNYHAFGTTRLRSGLYTCQRRVGRVQIDQGDGTFIEKELLYEVPLDEMINNRFHKWT